MRSLLFFIVLFVTATAVFAQNNGPVRFVALGKDVTVTTGELAGDTAPVTINFDGKNVKTFRVDDVFSPQIIGSFLSVDGDHFLYRSGMSSGACVGGSLFVMHFKEKSDGGLDSVRVSPPLTACLGEITPFNLELDAQGRIILRVVGHSLDLESMAKWIPSQKAPAKKGKR